MAKTPTVAGLRALWATPEGKGIAAGMGSGAVLAAALFSQHVGGLAPCALCILQRWPHALALLAAAALWKARGTHWARPLLLLGTVAAALAVATAFFHVGVESRFWGSPFGCGLPDWSDPNLATTLATTTPADCATPAWTFLGHSLAAWNMLLSSVLVGLWAGAWVKTGRDGLDGADSANP